jgi:hypothetical protein
MITKESYSAKLDRILGEIKETLSTKEWVKSRLYWEDWGSLLGELVSFAKQEIRRRRWRGGRSGVLPEGCDANSVAVKVIEEALKGNVRLAPGWTRERLLAELQRKVSHEVRRLHKLKEAGAMRSEWDVVKPGVDGEARSVLAWIPGGVGGTDLAKFEAADKERQMADLRFAERLE